MYGLDMLNTVEFIAQPEQQAKTFQFIGRCPIKSCNSVFHIEMQGQLVTRRDFFGHSFKKSMPVWPRIEIFCACHKRQIGWRQVEGTFSPEHVCDFRCTGARGHKCECSCGHSGGVKENPRMDRR
jgi:hypothetical protein